MIINNKYCGFIYRIYNDINDMIYIGQTKRTLRARFSHHKRDAKYHRYNSMLYNVMNKYGFENFHIEEIDCIDANSNKELQMLLDEWEKFYIRKYNSITPNGYNLSPGGNTSGLMARQIDLYTHDGDFVQTYDSASDLAEQYNITVQTVYKNCSGQSSWCKQGVIRFHDEPFDKYLIKDLRNVAPVDVYDTIGNYITTCKSFTDASERFDTDPTSVCGVCNGRHSSANYYVFRYQGDAFDLYHVKSLVVGKYNAQHQLIDRYLCPNNCMVLNNISRQKMDGHLSGRIQLGRDGYYYRYITTLNEYNALICT